MYVVQQICAEQRILDYQAYGLGRTRIAKDNAEPNPTPLLIVKDSTELIPTPLLVVLLVVLSYDPCARLSYSNIDRFKCIISSDFFREE